VGYNPPSVKRFGKYRLLEPLASGGMAEVWRAELYGPGGFAKEVALKLVRADLAPDPELARLFVQEARLASRLGHANVVQVFDFDVVEGRPYLAMELVRGRTLRQVTDRCRETGQRLGLARAVHVAAEVARALAHAHGLADGGHPLGIVHRDVSPQNVLLSFEGEVKLADFGIARALGAAERTAPGALQGKVAYMAPEQARGEEVDGRADLFALGVVLWELLAGRRLFARESEAATLAGLLAADPVSPPSAWNEAVPPELDRLVLAALEREVGRRTPDAERMWADLAAVRLQLTRSPEELELRPLLRSLFPDALRPAAAPEPTRRMEPPGEAPTRTVAAAGGNRRWWVAGALAALALAVGVGGMARRGGEGGATDVAARPEPPGDRSGRPAAHSPFDPAPIEASRAAEPVIHSGRTGLSASDAPTSTESPPSTPTARPAPMATGLARASGRIGSLPLPPAESGEGILAVTASPWAAVTIDGARLGDTPREWRLPAGRYRLEASHPGRRTAAVELELRPGARRAWKPRLAPER